MAQGVADGANALEKGLTNIDDHIAFHKLQKSNAAQSVKNLSFEEFVTRQRVTLKAEETVSEGFLTAQ